MSPSRRSFLIGSGAAVAPLSGCLGVASTNQPKIDLKLFNYTVEQQPLQFELLREDTDEYSEARVFDREFEIPPPGDDESAGIVRESDIAPRRRYLARVLLQFGKGQWHHHHFYPGESWTDDDSARIDIRVYRDEKTEELYVRFR